MPTETRLYGEDFRSAIKLVATRLRHEQAWLAITPGMILFVVVFRALEFPASTQEHLARYFGSWAGYVPSVAAAILWTYSVFLADALEKRNLKSGRRRRIAMLIVS